MNKAIIKYQVDENKRRINLTFNYNLGIIKKIKALEYKRWDPENKQWGIPIKYLNSLNKIFPPYEYLVIEREKFENEGINTSDPPIFNIQPPKIENLIPNNYQFKCKPFSYQLGAINFLLNLPKALLSLEMGLGKTYSSLVATDILRTQGKINRCLIICGVNNTKYNWVNEVEMFTDQQTHLLGVKGKYTKSLDERLVELDGIDSFPFYFIVNKETFRDERISDKLIELQKEGKFNAIIYDEIHKGLNFKSQQGKGILNLDTPYKFALTGTPIVNSPLDAANILRWLNYSSCSLKDLKSHFVVMKKVNNKGKYYETVDYYTNIKEINENINKIQFYKNKKECLDLPPKIYKYEYLEMKPLQNKVYLEVLEGIKENLDKIILLPNPLSELIRLRQVTSSPTIVSSTISDSVKFERTLEILNDITSISKDKKVLIFSNWVKVLNAFAPLVADYKPLLITGETKNASEQIEIFNTSSQHNLLLGTIGAMGTGLNLQKASYVIFLDEPWTSAAKLQAEDRAYRVGTKGEVTIYTLRCRGTIDEKIAAILSQKQGYAKEITKTNFINFCIS